MGKGLLLKNTLLYINQYDLSGLSRSFDSLLKTFERVDMTPWDYSVSRAIGNRCEVGIMGYTALLDVGTGKSADSLIADQDANVSLLIGEAGTPAVGDLAYSVPGVQLQGLLQIEAGAVGFAPTDFIPKSTLTNANYLDPWGVVLEINTRRTATKTGDTIDQGAQTTAGYSAFLHITVGGANYTIIIQDSINGSDWATLHTFTATGSAATSEHGGNSGTVDQYVRYLATKTSGDLLAVCVLCRN